MDQHAHLTPAVKKFLEDNEIVPVVCENCNRPLPSDLEIIGHVDGMFGIKYPLHRHQLKDGTFVDEYLQCTRWASGPNFFLGLRLPPGTTMTWTEEEINLVLIGR